MTARKLAITVLRGGPSAEREVSILSGTAMAEALQRRGHDVFIADIGPDDLSALDRKCDVVVIGLHGTWGEDGTLQRILEDRGLRFTCSGSIASAIAMDKIRSKEVAIAVGAQTARWRRATSANTAALLGGGANAAPSALASDAPPPDAELPTPLRPPLVVKPVDSGSSVATYIIRDPADIGQIAPALDDVIAKYGQALVEEFIKGEELTVAILEGNALPPIAIRPRQNFYDYHAKYVADDTEYVFDALPAGKLAEIQQRSERIFARMGCKHLARVDWIVTPDGTPYFLEVNTLPGFTSHSLVPKAAARVGVSFDELCERLALLGAEEKR